MNRYPAPELKDVPEDIKARILEVQEKAGAGSLFLLWIPVKVGQEA